MASIDIGEHTSGTTKLVWLVVFDRYTTVCTTGLRCWLMAKLRYRQPINDCTGVQYPRPKVAGSVKVLEYHTNFKLPTNHCPPDCVVN
jgi:hypothetical protein